MIVFIIIIAFILFIPIPIIVDLKYEDSKFLFYIFKIKINTSAINKKNTDKNLRKAKKKFDLNKFKKILSSFNRCKIKPWISFSLSLDFGLDDAALTGFTYGAIWCIYPLLNYLISIIFNIKKCTVNVKPYFNEKLLKFDLHSIIVTSLAKTIYIIIFTFIDVNKNN